MSPVLKADHGGRKSSKSEVKHSKSHRKQGSNDSVSSRQSYGSSSRASGSKSHKRRRSSPTQYKSSLQETISSFGDDVIKVKKPAGHYAYDNRGYIQPDLSPDNKHHQEEGQSSPRESGDNEFAFIMPHHDPSFRTRHFEKVKPSEVGPKPSKWQRLLQASITSTRFQKKRGESKIEKGKGWSSETSFAEDFYNDNGTIEYKPPFWGVSARNRSKFSFLSLSLILHELACFTSCVLLGCMLFQGMEVISWVEQKPLTENWLLFKWYSSFQTLLVLITCVGFLNRVDTTDVQSLWSLPFFLGPVLALSVSDYCNKAWERQRLECFSYFRLDEIAKDKVHLSQDCSSILPPSDIATLTKHPIKVPTDAEITVKSLVFTELQSRGTGPLVMRLLAMFSILIIAVYLFCCRRNHFMIDLFGPPSELGGNLGPNPVMPKSRNKRGESQEKMHASSSVDTQVIFRRGERNRY